MFFKSRGALTSFFGVFSFGANLLLLMAICPVLTPKAFASPDEASPLIKAKNQDLGTYLGLKDSFSHFNDSLPQNSPLSNPKISDRKCAVVIPLQNAIAPSIPDAQTEPPQSLPTSTCADDLTGINSSISPSENIIVQNQTTDSTDSPATNENPEANAIETNNPWQFKFQPYGTIPVTVYGDTTIRGQTFDYHLGLGDLLDVLRFTVSARAEAWKGNLGFIVDAYYVSLEGSGIAAAPRFPLANLKSTLSFNQGIYDFAVSYNFGDNPQFRLPDKDLLDQDAKPFPRIWFQPIAGVRLNDINATINQELTLGGLGRTFQTSFSNGRTWLEPLLGGKLGVQLSDPLTLWFRGDASGFGLAGDTDLSWNLFFGADWWVTKNISLQLAYRFYEIDYQNGSGNDAFGFKQSFNGPVIGATFFFN